MFLVGCSPDAPDGLGGMPSHGFGGEMAEMGQVPDFGCMEPSPELDQAIGMANVACVDKALKQGASAKEKTTGFARSEYPLHLALEESVKFFGGETKQLHIIKLLIASGADINQTSGSSGNTPLLVALANKNLPAASLLASVSGCDLDHVNASNETALLLAMEMGNKTLFNELIAKGADMESPESNRPLLVALTNKNSEFASVLIDKGASLNIADKSGNSVLHIAIKGGDQTLAKTLVSKTDIKKKNNAGETALHLAASAGMEGLVTALVSQGAELNEVQNDAQTALHLAVQQGHTAIVSYLIEQGAEVTSKDKNQQTPLHSAKTFEIAKLLVGAGADVNATDSHDGTPLSEACWKKDLNLVKFLVASGANVLDEDNDGRTLLFDAIGSKNIAIASYLIEQGVEVNHRANDGRTAMFHAKSVESINLLHSKGADVDVLVGQEAPLVSAVDLDQVEVVKRLLELGANPNRLLRGDDTYLHSSVIRGFAKVTKLLVDAGANVNAVNVGGFSPLHLVVRPIFAPPPNVIEILKLLVEAKADVNLPLFNQSPLKMVEGRISSAKMAFGSAKTPEERTEAQATLDMVEQMKLILVGAGAK